MDALAAACNRSTQRGSCIRRLLMLSSFKNQRRPVCWQFSIWPCERWAGILSQTIIALARFPFVRTNRPDHYRRYDNFTFSENSSARSVKSLVACMKEFVSLSKNSWTKPTSWLVQLESALRLLLANHRSRKDYSFKMCHGVNLNS